MLSSNYAKKPQAFVIRAPAMSQIGASNARPTSPMNVAAGACLGEVVPVRHKRRRVFDG
jgi:hypothetical protein